MERHAKRKCVSSLAGSSVFIRSLNFCRLPIASVLDSKGLIRLDVA